MAWDSIPRTHSFSLGDFHDFDFCVFRFFVNHHLQKKYELSEGNANQAIGSLLDLTIKKLHQAKAYSQPVDYLINLVKAAKSDMENDVAQRGANSFYGAQVPFLTPEVVTRAQEVFKSYHEAIGGKYKPLVLTQTMKKLRPFWKHVINTEAEPVQLWGGPDAIELGVDGVPEIIDYKYRENIEDQSKMDMDLMPKVYTLLCASELMQLGYPKARFKVKFWLDPLEESFYEEFDLSSSPNLEAFFKDKILKILRTTDLSFCEKEFCKVCKSPNRDQWLTELQLKGWVVNTDSQETADLPF
ncbi:PD-(D/E)XK nuclease family protein [Patescibacteria group bacterium]|nr:PD-(D/E)XK nuclease family protein [Patescibacteria group bacterium]